LIDEGMSAEDARAAARRAFGCVAIAQERFYAASRWMRLDQFLQDLRYAWRGMRRSLAFVATTVLTLAVGLGLLTVAYDLRCLRLAAVREPRPARPSSDRLVHEKHLWKRSSGRSSRSPASASSNPLSLEMLMIWSPVFAAFVLVLVTACANISNGMPARAVARHRELSVRLSLGASRARLVRQLLTEGLLIAAVAGLAGLALAAWGLRVAIVSVVSTLPPSVAPLLRFVPLTFDYRLFLFVLSVLVSATVMFALLPALQASRLPLTDALRGQGVVTHRGSRLRNLLVMTTENVHATAILARGRSGRDLGPEAFQEIFRRVVPDPQVFEVLPLGEMRDLQVYPLRTAS
jgi:hypothetical protein